jgi:dienelactone hydrolase
LTSKGHHVEQEVNVSASNTLKIISFIVSGYKEYGALLIPKSDKLMPVRMYVGGFAHDVAENTVNLVVDNSQPSDPFIFAGPALRGQALRINVNGTAYTTPVSEGIHCDAFDGAADDVIAILNGIVANEQQDDANRVSVRGGSRGATVALLVAERDKRIKGAIAVAGPCNMLELTSKRENDATYQCQFLQDLVDGNETIDQARQTMIASSPLFFANRLSKTQYHLAADDKIVPIVQGDQLVDKMRELGLSNKLEYYVYEGRDHANITTSKDELNTRIEQFLSVVLK